ncbi:MAG: DUF2855 family protein [Pseudomonadota bacterium]
MSLALEVLRRDIRDGAASAQRLAPLADGAARMRVDMVALTANTVTYAVVGAQIGYWKFWPCATEGRGIVPAWGFATCIESRSDEIAPGARFYGCWALAETLDVRPHATKDGFADTDPRRDGLAPLYARYTRAGPDPSAADPSAADPSAADPSAADPSAADPSAADPSAADPSAAEAEARRALLEPLLATGWLLTDHIEAHERFGAERVIISAASSKTAIGLAAGLREAGIATLGLTSPGNAAFVASTGLYDDVRTYDAVPALDPMPSVFVDMAGSAPLRQALHQALAGGRLTRSIGVGAAHWQDIAAAPDLPDPQPEFFFAPAWSEKRIKDWGAEQLLQRMGGAMHRWIGQSGAWLRVDRRPASGLVAAWQEAAAGRQSPQTGVVIDF